MKRNESGFSLMETLVAAAVLGIGAVVISSMMTSQETSSRFISQKMDALDIQQQLHMVMADQAVCACHLNPDLTPNDINDPNLNFDLAVADGSQSLPLPAIRTGCLADSPVVVSQGQRISTDLSIRDIEFANLRPTGNLNEWQGIWRVRFTSPRERISIMPLEVPQVVIVRPGPSSVDPATIESCKGPISPGLLATCPTGMTLIGTPSTIGSYCIDVAARSSARFIDAKAACHDMGPGFGPGHLCTHNEWYVACRDNVFNPALSGTEAESEFIADFDGVNYLVTAGYYPNNPTRPAAVCDRVWYKSPLASVTSPFRCCLK